MTFLDTKLTDKYDLTKTRVYMSGTQALIRLCLEQSARDRAAGLNTGGYVTGYRGSPVGGLDLQFGQAKTQLSDAHVQFEPALNEDLAATAIWGTQQAELRGDGAYDGVFAMWYGKGPGVDRSGDALRHANLAGTSPNGGALVLMGDDHTCESSTTAHQSDFALVDAMIPILNPANISDLLDYGLHGFALSRFSGLYCGLKLVKDNVESSGSVDVDLANVSPQIPSDFVLPADGLNIRLNDHPTTQEARLHQHKLNAVRAYSKANKLDKTIWSGGPKRRLGIVSTGKSYMDTLQALEALGINQSTADKLGIALYKIAMPWPLEPDGIKEFADGLENVIVVEEKRGLIEDQMRVALYGQKNSPSIVGKKDEHGDVLFQPQLALNPTQVAVGIADRIPKLPTEIKRKRDVLKQRLSEQSDELPVARGLVFCAGCPHNASAKGPEGSRQFAGIGCHWMAQFTTDQVEGYTHMGAEGANWIGEAKFSNRDHVFQNIGDGTYNHSGLLAIRAAAGANVNMTYKILFNDAVALTGGQTNDGGLDVYRIAAEVAAAGIKKLEFVTEDPDRIDRNRLPKGVQVHPRTDLMKIQKELSQIKGVTVLIYDQTCASEKRRRRKRGLMADEPKRVYINPDICEGCGDCSVQSSCVAVQPLETELGRKRKIDQSLCNKDFSCLDGFCPSFVTITGAVPKTENVSLSGLPKLPEPRATTLDKSMSILVTGVGGTGVVTIGAIVGMAAHMDGLASGVIDMAGLSQKGGAVTSHIKLASAPDAVKAIRVPAGGADLVLGCDMIVSASNVALTTLGETSHVILNTHQQMPGDFARNRDLNLPVDLMERRIANATSRIAKLDATKLASRLLGDSIGTNMLMLGAAFQKGLVPLSLQAIESAITLNGVAVQMNLDAFMLGRQAIANPNAVADLLPKPAQNLTSLPDIITDRAKRLTDYQNNELASRYTAKIEHLLRISGNEDLTRAVARNYYKLLAVKDEYEVARLYSSGSFQQGLDQSFANMGRIQLHLAPPLISRPDPHSGKAKKYTFGPWILPVLRLLAKGKGIRGKWFDPFSKTAERKAEQNLIKDYEEFLATLLVRDASYDTETALALAELPQDIRGFGHVKMASIKQADTKRAQLMVRLTAKPDQVAAE